jgi:adenylate cyclase class 1
VAHDHFKQSTQTTRLLLLFNIGIEPQADLHKKGMQMLSNQRDALGYSGFKENLVITADIVQINSWQEVVCRHYNSDAIVNSLLHYLRMLPPGNGLTLPELTIRCFSTHQGHIITQRLEELWSDIIACYYSGLRSRNCRYILEMGDEYLLLQFLQQQPHITRYKSYEDLLEKLSNAQISYSPIVIDRYALKNQAVKLFNSAISAPGVYIFFQILTQKKSVAQLSILDERGSLFTANLPYHNQQTLLRPLHRFIRSVIERQCLHGDIDIQQRMTKNIQFFEIMGNTKLQQGFLESRNTSSDISQIKFVNIAAIAEPDTEGNIIFNIYCDEIEFSTMEYGHKLYLAVARYILQHRRNEERYPCYITDLDLSLCRDLIAPQTGLQLTHYLQVKANIEQQLNNALGFSV